MTNKGLVIKPTPSQPNIMKVTFAHLEFSLTNMATQMKSNAIISRKENE
jgi:hypothetical protein